MIRRPPRSTLSSSSAASDVYKRQSRTVPARPRTPPSPTWRLPPTAARSRRVHRRVLTGWPSTTSSCASRSCSASRPPSGAATPWRRGAPPREPSSARPLQGVEEPGQNGAGATDGEDCEAGEQAEAEGEASGPPPAARRPEALGPDPLDRDPQATGPAGRARHDGQAQADIACGPAEPGPRGSGRLCRPGRARHQLSGLCPSVAAPAAVCFRGPALPAPAREPLADGTRAPVELHRGDQAAGPAGLPAGVPRAVPLRDPAGGGTRQHHDPGRHGHRRPRPAARGGTVRCPRHGARSRAPADAVELRTGGLVLAGCGGCRFGRIGEGRHLVIGRVDRDTAPVELLVPGDRHARILEVTPPPPADPGGQGVSETDLEAVAALLGRPPSGEFEVVVRAEDGAPAVIADAPFLYDGTPMPTRYWLVDAHLREEVSRLESRGGVRQAEAEVDADRLAAAHALYAAEREALIDPGHRGPRPSGGVGGTRRGVKCLHAHLAWWLTGADDPIGQWTAEQIGLHPA